MWRRVPQALVVAGFVAVLVSAGALLADHKTVRLSVDGAHRTLHTFADDVGELLAAEGVTTGRYDLVTPAPRTRLDGGEEVVVRWGRPLRLDLDGRARRVWTTARTVDEACAPSASAPRARTCPPPAPPASAGRGSPSPCAPNAP